MLGSPRTTDDFDICPATSRANLERLAAMLNDVEARWAPPGMEETGFEPVEPCSFEPIQTHSSGTPRPIPSASTIAIASWAPRKGAGSLVLSSLSPTTDALTKVPTPRVTKLTA